MRIVRFRNPGRLGAALLVSASLIIAPVAHAARPYVTDDARIVPSGGCQIETWVHRFRGGGAEFWALPACTPGNIEFTFGGNTLPGFDGEPSTQNLLLQGKWLLRTLDTGIGTGFVVGGTSRVRGPRAAASPSSLSTLYAYNITSFSFDHERFVLLTMLGARHDRNERRNEAFWGLGSETLLFRRGEQELILAKEVYGTDRGRPSWQAGFRFWLVKDRIQVDAVMGARFDGRGDDARWWSIGLRIIEPNLLR